MEAVPPHSTKSVHWGPPSINELPIHWVSHKCEILRSACIYVHELGCTYIQLVPCSRIQSVQLHMFSTAQLSTLFTVQLSNFHKFYGTNNMDHHTSTIPHQYPPFKKYSDPENTFREAACLQSPAELIPVLWRWTGNCTTVCCKCFKAKAKCTLHWCWRCWYRI